MSWAGQHFVDKGDNRFIEQFCGEHRLVCVFWGVPSNFQPITTVPSEVDQKQGGLLRVKDVFPFVLQVLQNCRLQVTCLHLLNISLHCQATVCGVVQWCSTMPCMRILREKSAKTNVTYLRVVNKQRKNRSTMPCMRILREKSAKINVTYSCLVNKQKKNCHVSF